MGTYRKLVHEAPRRGSLEGVAGDHLVLVFLADSPQVAHREGVDGTAAHDLLVSTGGGRLRSDRLAEGQHGFEHPRGSSPLGLG